MSGPIKHSTTGLWVGGKKKTTRGQRRGVMNIHVVGGLNGCCLKELWPLANSLDIKRQLLFVSPHHFQMSMSEPHNGQGPVCPQVTPKIPTSTLFSFYSVSRFGLESLPAKWCSAEWQINRATAALAGARFSILGSLSFNSLPNISRMHPPDTRLCQLDWNWGLPRHNGSVSPFPSVISLLWEDSRKGIIQHICLCICTCV